MLQVVLYYGNTDTGAVCGTTYRSLERAPGVPTSPDLFRGDESRRRRGCNVDIPWRRVAATPRLQREYSVAVTPRLQR